MLWYSPVLFGNIWIRLTGLNKKYLQKAKQKGMAKTLIVAFISVLISSYILSYFINISGATTLADGAQIGFWIWLGFIATVMLGSILWENKPFKLYLINTSRYLLALVVMGAILAVWV